MILSSWLCIALCLFDLALGGVAAFKPQIYAHVFHPDLAVPPVDFIARTGMIWLFFAGVEGVAAWKRRPVGFFLVGMLRLMDVPADVMYGAMARGASLFSRSAIFFSPLANLMIGIYLVSRMRRSALLVVKK